MNHNKFHMNKTGDLKSAPLWLRIVALCFFLASVAINVYFGVFGNHNTQQTSNLYSLPITPPAWSFSIWGAIYGLLLLVLVYVIWKDRWNSNSYYLLIVVCILNALWVGIFSIGSHGALIACLFIIAALAGALFLLWNSLHEPLSNDWVYFAVRNVISLYLGWIIAASILNLLIVLVYVLGSSLKAATIAYWVITPLIFIGLTVLVYSKEKAHGIKSFVGFWLAGLWAMSGSLVTTLNHKDIFTSAPVEKAAEKVAEAVSAVTSVTKHHLHH